ncbi:TPA: ABC transporter permease subunit [Klebsiella quasipneumoniae]
MAAPLRYPLILLAWGTMAAIYLPLFPAAAGLVWPALSPVHWRALFADPQLGQALAATLVSTLLSVGGALLIALTIVAALWPSARWRRLASRLPLLLAVPHLALATAALLLFAEGGWIWQRLPFLTPPVDRYGIGLGLTMALKESAFVLWVVPWMLFILRPAWRQRDPRMAVIARTLGWDPTRIFWLLTLPSLTRPLLTALAVGFSVSIAQYLPTLWLGAGRIPTLTSQAVALSSGGEAQTLAAQALWQLLLPAVCFTLTALLAWLAGRYRRGLR